jgi:cation-transporting ATPase E
MNHAKKDFLRKVRDVSFIIIRNVFMLIHVIIFAVIILLIVFGDTQEGLFLGIILLVNIVLGLSQELRAWSILEKLDLLTALHCTRIKNDGTEETVPIEDIVKGDRLKLILGDQIPSDGSVVSTESFEVNEALITGESVSLPKKTGDELLGGSAHACHRFVRGQSCCHDDKKYQDVRARRKSDSKIGEYFYSMDGNCFSRIGYFSCDS